MEPMRSGPQTDAMTPERDHEEWMYELQHVLAAVASVLKLVDEQWDSLDEHQRRNAVKLSLDTARSYAPIAASR